MSHGDSDGCGWLIAIVCVVMACIGSCHRGYEWGYNAHRRAECTRNGGVWMVSDLNEDRRACVTGERR